MTNSQALSITDRLDTKLATKLDTKQNQQQTAQSSLAIMQAGIDTALQKATSQD